MASTTDGIKWWGFEYKTALSRELRRSLKEAGNVLRDDIKKSISISGRTQEVITTRTGRTRIKIGKKGSFPSSPGEPPHVFTGNLKRSAFSKLVKKGTAVRAGVKGPHAHLLEFGTKRMMPRPFIRPALVRVMPRIQKILTRPITVRVVA